MRKKLLSILLSVGMVLTLLPTAALAAESISTFGGFSVTYDGTEPAYTDGVLTFSAAGTYTVSMKTGTSSTSDRIVISAPGVTLNLNGVTIAVPPAASTTITGATAVTVTSDSVTLNVMADSSLTGGNGCAAGEGNETGSAGGAGLNGNVAVTGNATLAVTGGAGGSGHLGEEGDDGRAGFGIIGNVAVSGSATVIAVSGSGGAGMAIIKSDKSDGGTITVDEGYTVAAGADADHATVLPTDSTSTNERYVKITPPAPQAQWGLAGSGGAAPASGTWAGSGTLAAAMTYASGLSDGTAYVQLLTDVNTSDSLKFKSGKTTVLDLNGKTIDRGLTAAPAASVGSGIEVNGSLTLRDSSTNIVANQGKITGGYNNNGGGGVHVNQSGSFTMTGGRITGNTSTDTSAGGGGVYVSGSFTMTGGSITNNNAPYKGGGVFVFGSFTMLGGSISGNNTSNSDANRGGGVCISPSTHAAAAITVGGKAVIQDNTNTSGSTVETRNVCLDVTGKTITVSAETPLANGASIGITTFPVPTAGSPVNITGANSANYSGYFTSDNASYAVQTSGSDSAQVVRLAVPAPTVTAVSPTGGSAAGGTSVTITGTNLSNAIAVEFGSTLATSFLVTSSTSITATAPAGTGTVDITVTAAGGTSVTSAASKFTYVPTAAEYASGASSPADYSISGTTLTIYTAKGAAYWSANGSDYLDYTVRLAANIVVSGFLWTPVGSTSNPFVGSFDGQGHSISGLHVEGTVVTAEGTTAARSGIFGYTGNNALIKNIRIINASVIATVSQPGNSSNNLIALAGVISAQSKDSRFINCFTSGSVSANDGELSYGGGLAASSDRSSFTNCYSAASVTCADGTLINYAGGLVGYLDSGTLANIGLTNCYSTGIVQTSGGSDYIGGLAGYCSNNPLLTNCFYLAGSATKGVGAYSSLTATGCGTFDSAGTLTAGTADQFGTGQTPAYANTLLNALNGWVNGQASTAYYTWQADSGSTNGGYPVFGGAWVAQAQWGVAGTENAAPGTWVHSGSLTDAVAYANANSGTYIQLLADVDTTVALEFEENKTTVLDLNGKTINGRNIPEGDHADRNVLGVSGNLTLCDSRTTTVANQGEITGGHGTGDGPGGGVYVYPAGRFTMTGGNITGNTATTGGGITNTGTFAMTGGSIAGNSCISSAYSPSCGGGVSSLGDFTMSGGSITDNTVGVGGAGGGVFSIEGMTLSGNVNISGNTVGTASGDVALMGFSGHSPCICISGALTASTAIGVSIVELSQNVFTPQEGVFTSGETVPNSDYLAKFVSDNSGFAVIADGRQLKLAAAKAITKADATHGSFTVKVNGNKVPSATGGQTVTVTPAADSGYELDTVSVYKTGDPSITVSVAGNAFTMPDYAVKVSVTFKAVAEPPSGGGTTAPTGAPVIVDGKTENIGTENTSGKTTTVTVDLSKLGTNIGGAASGSSVVVPVSENGSATASLVVKNIEDMAAKSMILTVQTRGVFYNLNTSAIDTAALTAAFPGADMSKVPFDVTIANSSVSVEGETLVLSPVAFTVTVTYGGKTVDVDAFSAYIDRVIEVTAEQAAKITTAVVVNTDGSIRHVPTNVIEKGGKYYAVINSRTNSTYALIQNEVTFADAKGKWYEAAVNEMGSRKIISGRSASAFDGDASITRAEFAVILVRALGLPADGISTFSDIPADAWYTGAAAAAAQYGIVSGKGGNQFDPTSNITRQEAMLMLQRAAALTEFTGASGKLDSFADADSVDAWARDAAKWSVGSGLIQGSGGKLNPTADITRAESAAIILRLLQKASLVDVRSEA